MRFYSCILLLLGLIVPIAGTHLLSQKSPLPEPLSQALAAQSRSGCRRYGTCRGSGRREILLSGQQRSVEFTTGRAG